MSSMKKKSLAETHPELAKQWHPTKNGKLTPEMVTYGSGKNVHWILPYDDPKTGKHYDFEWTTRIRNRAIRGHDCPYLTGQKLWLGFNDLATTHPELAKQWHPTKNGNLTPEMVTAGNNKKVWWILPYDDLKTGKHHDFDWTATINDRATKEHGCPYLAGQKVWLGFNDLATTHPELAKQWHPTKNGNLTPEMVTAGSSKNAHWILPYDDPKTGKHYDFEWTTSITNRTLLGSDCPYLTGHKVWLGFNDLATTHPELAKQWHPTKNGNLTPEMVTAGSGKRIWWKCEKGHTYQTNIHNRKGRRCCPKCSESNGERNVADYLKNHDLAYKKNATFNNLYGTGGQKLQYDFKIKNQQILIEFNGRQHYESVDLFGGKQQFEKQKEHDKRKKEFAKKNGYFLIAIPYTCDTYEKVEEYLDKKLLPKRCNCKKGAKLMIA